MGIRERIVFEDNHLLIINKLAGELVQSDSTGDPSLVDKARDYIREEYNKPGNVFVGLVHRLDRPTSGLLIFAKTSKALARMNEVFKKREVQKRYFAIVKIEPPHQKRELRHFLRKNGEKNKSSVVSPGVKGAKEARLEYQLLTSSDKYYLLAVLLHTGRHHQIRVQLAQEGMPIKGDLKYGFPRSNADASISLHAGHLSFTHPVRKTALDFRAPCLSRDVLWDVFNPQILEE